MPLLDRMKREAAVRFHEEIMVDNFSKLDCDLSFYSLVRSLYHRTEIKSVLDYGAGRNRYEQDFDPKVDSHYIKDLRDLRFGGATVTAVDVDPGVTTHPTSAQQFVIDPDQPLPFEQESFDLIVSDYVFEHVEKPQVVARELLRVLKPGGHLFVRTPNKRGYVKLFSALVPNRLHDIVLERVSPQRKSKDTFPTFYRLNSKRDIQRYFTGCDVAAVHDSWEPAYFFGKPVLYRLLRTFHKWLPDAFSTACIFIIRKR